MVAKRRTVVRKASSVMVSNEWNELLLIVGRI
jgi:hypothetical protein